MSLSSYDTNELLEELERRNFKVAIKIIGVDVECRIGDREFGMKIDYRIHIIAAILFSSMIGFAIGVNYDVCGLR